MIADPEPTVQIEVEEGLIVFWRFIWPHLEDQDRFDDLPLEVDEVSYNLHRQVLRQAESIFALQLVHIYAKISNTAAAGGGGNDLKLDTASSIAVLDANQWQCMMLWYLGAAVSFVWVSALDNNLLTRSDRFLRNTGLVWLFFLQYCLSVRQKATDSELIMYERDISPPNRERSLKRT